MTNGQEAGPLGLNNMLIFVEDFVNPCSVTRTFPASHLISQQPMCETLHLLVSCGCANKLTQSLGLKTTHFLYFWKSEVQNEYHWAEIKILAEPCSLWRP